MANRSKILVPSVSCGSLHANSPSGLLIDGRDVYKAVYDACSQAKRTIVIAGWQFDNSVRLLRGEDAVGAEHPTHFVGFLRDLCERRPELEIYLLAWDASAVFAFERVPLQRLLLRLPGHPRIHYRMDKSHPIGASEHQKFVVVDRAIALLGGMDICNSRWDRRDHRVGDPDRHNRWRTYRPYHDVHAYVTGDPVDVLRGWFAERWKRATEVGLQLPHVPIATITIEPTLELHAPLVGLARTCPRRDDPPRNEVAEIYQLHLRAIAAAEQLIYLENQYLSSEEIGRALERRLSRGGDRLQIVIALPARLKGFKERLSMGMPQARILKRLSQAASRFGHRLGVYYSAAPDRGREVPVFVHSKVLVVDDRFLLVSSANATNRSMGFDSELGIAWEAPEPQSSIRAARIELMAELCGLPRAEANDVLAPMSGLVERLDDLAQARSHRLRHHAKTVNDQPGWPWSKLLHEHTALDPRDPRSFHEALPEPVALLDRYLREPIAVVLQELRQLLHRRSS